MEPTSGSGGSGGAPDASGSGGSGGAPGASGSGNSQLSSAFAQAQQEAQQTLIISTRGNSQLQALRARPQ